MSIGPRKSHNNILALLALAAILICSLPASVPLAQIAQPYQATLVIHAERPGTIINRNIYGHFAEHLGRLIYEGLWVGENSSIPNTHGLRNDVLAALKELRIRLEQRRSLRQA